MSITTPLDLVLLVDDNDTDNFISKRFIELNKFASQIEVKTSGKDALEYLETNQNNLDKLPNLIFLDINMPITDGFVFLYEFEQLNPIIKEKCKVAILSSSKNQRDITRIADNDYVIKHIVKPLTADSLKEALSVL